MGAEGRRKSGQVAMEECLRIIFGRDEGEGGPVGFGERLRARVVRYLDEMVSLGREICADGLTGFGAVLRQYIVSRSFSRGEI